MKRPHRLLAAFVVLAIAGLAHTAPIAAAAKAKPIELACPIPTIDEPGSYVVTKALNSTPQCAAPTLLEIRASNVTLDLNHRTIAGQPGSCAQGIFVSGTSRNVKIRNGTLLACDIGVEFGSDVTKSSVTGLTIFGGDHGIFGGDGISVVNTHVNLTTLSGVVLGDGAKVTGSTVSRTGGRGIKVDNSSIVSRNTVHGNDEEGIVAGNRSLISSNHVVSDGHGVSAGDGNTIARNVIDVAPYVFYGIDAKNDNNIRGNVLKGGGACIVVLARNTISGNVGDSCFSGISGSTGNLITKNRVRGAFSGIAVNSDNVVSKNTASGNAVTGIQLIGTGNTVSGNNASGNGGDGIQFSTADSGTRISRNVTNDNVDDGLEADAAPNLATGGGNRAANNGDVDCAPVTLC